VHRYPGATLLADGQILIYGGTQVCAVCVGRQSTFTLAHARADPFTPSPSPAIAWVLPLSLPMHTQGIENIGGQAPQKIPFYELWNPGTSVVRQLPVNPVYLEASDPESSCVCCAPVAAVK
jgi:hypothetical protein